MAKGIGSANMESQLLGLIEQYAEEPKKDIKKEQGKMDKLAIEIKDVLNQPKISQNALQISEKERDFLMQKIKEDKSSSKEVLYIKYEYSALTF